MTLPEERPWSMDLLDAHPRRHRKLKVDDMRILDAIRETRRVLKRSPDLVATERDASTCRLVRSRKSTNSTDIFVSMPSIVVAYLPDPIHEEERIGMASHMLDVAEHALRIGQTSIGETCVGIERRVEFATLLGRLARHTLGEYWRDDAFVEITETSPFGPATASIRTTSRVLTGGIRIPESVAEPYGLGSEWMLSEERDAKTSIVLMPASSSGSFPFDEDHPIEVMRHLARPGVAEFIRSLAEAYRTWTTGNEKSQRSMRA